MAKAQRSFHCRHYSYKPGDGPVCAVDALHADGTVVRCMPTPQRDACPKREEYTEAEKDAQESDMFASAENLMKVLALIPVKSTAGEIPCPVCGTGTVTYRYFGLRAIRVWCSTDGCIRFMS